MTMYNRRQTIPQDQHNTAMSIIKKHKNNSDKTIRYALLSIIVAITFLFFVTPGIIPKVSYALYFQPKEQFNHTSQRSKK